MTVSEQVLSVLADAMGPAAGKFLERQCKFYLDKPVDSLTVADLETLAYWVDIGAKAALGDAMADRLKKQITALK